MSKKCGNCGIQLDSSGNCQACLFQLGMSGGASEPSPELPDSALPSLDELNGQFPQLEITRLVGRGGMGAIYHARQTALDRDVALKLIAKEVSGDTAFLERFEREAKTLAKLSHPNIVTVYDFGRTPDGMAYLIMEFVDGINLREAITSGSVGPDDALELVATICRALEYAHSKGVVHRDIKPENILLGEDGTLKVADFGIAKILDDTVRSPTLTATRQVLGSLHYLAPEHLESPEQVDHRVDLYALGVVFYELLTGQLPLGRYEPPSALFDRIDQRIDAIVMKTLSRKPVQRYQQASELSSDLQEVVAGGYQQAPVAAEPRETRRVASVPFKCEAMGGFAEAVGVVHANHDTLSIEFRMRDVFWGSVKSQTHTVDIPVTKLTRLELATGVFSHKMIITTDKISTLGSLPNAETGRAELKIQRGDGDFAWKVIQALGFGRRDGAPDIAAGTPAIPEKESSRRVVLAILLLFCSILNAGALAIMEVIIVEEIRHDIELVAAVVGMAVLIGPVALLQFVAGLLNLVARPRSLNVAVCVVSILPISPAWFLSMPLGIWALRWLNSSRLTWMPKPVKLAKSKGWGTTTLMFIRERRWGRIFAVLNGLGLCLLLVAWAFYQLGFYSVTSSYRIVSIHGEVDHADFYKAVRTRLESVDGTVSIRGNLETGGRLVLATQKRFQPLAQELLSVEGSIACVWLAPSKMPDKFEKENAVDVAAQQQLIPMASGMAPAELAAEQVGFGQSAWTIAQPIPLEENLVSKVSRHSGGLGHPVRITVELTSRGRDLLMASLPENVPYGGLGLVVQGLIEGVATTDAISNKRVSFRLASESDLTAAGIMAGIRGPQLPVELELLP